MLKEMVHWYRDWENEQLRVLDDPNEILKQQPGVRRTLNAKLAEMSKVERMQLRDFSLKYRGWRFVAALGGWFAVFSLIGLVLYFMKPEKGLAAPLAMLNLMGLGALIIFGTAWFNYRKMAEHQFRFFGIIIGCAAAGGLAGFSHAAFERGESFRSVLTNNFPKLGMILLSVVLFIAVPMAIIGALRNRQYQVLTSQLAFDADRQRLERELSEARLRMLSAQIEPHFLFNTLGAVQQLAEQGAPRAAELTANLIAFLRASLSEMRTEKVSLRSDFAMVDAYLKVMQVRQGNRLSYSLALSPEVADCTVPSMMLLTLVENAIKHGIEPSLRGGHISVAATQEHGALKLTVHDTGSGMSVTPGSGEGLDNIRKRLQLTYGAAASLTLQDADGGGLMAEILIYILS
ncbi:MAG: histidine kinase [Pseudomonadota bacterium]